jgi:LAO/AO transport system kinase
MSNDLTELVLAGNRRAVARLLTVVEAQEAQPYLAKLFLHTGRAWVVGITGSPGSGKSTLVTALARHYRAQGKTVAIIAVDPTSPYSGGAILGDRIRMRDLAGDSGVFIRSMATRGSLGGLAQTTRDMIRVFDAAGFEYVLVETVGAGQSEIEIVRVASTTIVVEAPGMGDDIQAIKAGILEIADILVVNKCDRIGAAQTVRALRSMLEIGHPTRTSHHGQWMETSHTSAAPVPSMWVPPVLQTVATENRGIPELAEAVESHRAFRQGQPDDAEARERARAELLERMNSALLKMAYTLLPSDVIEPALDRILAKQADPQSVVDDFVTTLFPDKITRQG